MHVLIITPVQALSEITWCLAEMKTCIRVAVGVTRWQITWLD